MTIEEREERVLTLEEVGRELDEEEYPVTDYCRSPMGRRACECQDCEYLGNVCNGRQPSPLGELFAELMAGGVGYDCKEVTR